jgi:UDP-N-acetylglucosamine 2-epimerase (non-hydrolysing)
LNLEERSYFLVTLHRAENVDEPDRLERFFGALDNVATEHGQPVLVSVHPRTADKLRQHGVSPASERVRLLEPLGFFDFVRL